MAKKTAVAASGDEHSRKQHVTIPAPKFCTAEFTIVGESPYVQNKFSHKASQQMKEKQEAGSTGNKGKQRNAKDFQECYEGAMHKARDGWYGIPAPAFRNACISACRIVGFKMTLAKLSIFIEADGYDIDDGTPLVEITKGQPQYHEAIVSLPNGMPDIRARPMWREGWEAKVRIRFDGDQFTASDVANLLTAPECKLVSGKVVLIPASPLVWAGACSALRASRKNRHGRRGATTPGMAWTVRARRGKAGKARQRSARYDVTRYGKAGEA